MPLIKLFHVFPGNIKIALTLLLVIIVISTVGYHFLENVDMFTAFYWTIVTITTIGYGDIIPETAQGRMFSIIIIISGVAIVLYTFTSSG